MSQEWIKESQIIQPNINKLIIKIVPIEEEKSREKENKLLCTLRETIKDDEMEIQVEYVDEIYPTKAGKRPFVISKVNQ